MPLFEYKCPSCHHITEKFQTRNAPMETECEQCSAEAKRIPSMFGFTIPGFQDGQAIEGVEHGSSRPTE
jgi:putative FmdB family regulatory protein